MCEGGREPREQRSLAGEALLFLAGGALLFLAGGAFLFQQGTGDVWDIKGSSGALHRGLHQDSLLLQLL
jgi:hypothetical protein